MNNPQVFACSRASVEMQIKDVDGAKASFMKFIFLQSPEAQVQ